MLVLAKIHVTRACTLANTRTLKSGLTCRRAKTSWSTTTPLRPAWPTWACPAARTAAACCSTLQHEHTRMCLVTTANYRNSTRMEQEGQLGDSISQALLCQPRSSMHL